MPLVLGVLERREQVALARAEELRAELERVQAAVAEAEQAARRAVIAREETVEALVEAADQAVVPAAPAGGSVVEPVAGAAGSRLEVPLWCEGLGVGVLPPDCARIVALVERDAAGGSGGVPGRRSGPGGGWPGCSLPTHQAIASALPMRVS
jgi:hypothetical protein